MKDIKEDLKAAVEEFVRRAIAEIARFTKDGTELPTRRVPGVKFDGPVRLVSTSTVPSWGDVSTFSFYQRLRSLPEVEGVRKVASHYPPIREVLKRMSTQNEGLSDEAVAEYFVMQWLANYLGQYLLRTQNVVRFSEAAFQQAFDAVDTKMRGEYRLRAFSCLFRFGMADPLIDLDSVRIRRMTNEEKATLFARFEAGLEFTVEKLPMDPLLFPQSILDADYVLEAEVDMTAASGSQTLQALSKAFEDAITTVRLLRLCGSYAGAVHHYQIDWLEEASFFLPQLGEFHRVYGPRLEVGKDDIAVVKSIFNMTSSLSRTDAPGLALALDRYERTLQDARPEDRVVDAFIGLEALLLADDRSELAFRLALRLARLVGESTEERHDIFDFVRKAYRIRSKIVHGDKSPEAANLASRLQDLLREGIRRALARPEWHDRQALVRDMDSRLLS